MQQTTLCFNTRDIEILKQLDEKELFYLNMSLLISVNESNRNVTPDLTSALIELSERAAQEVAERLDFAPVSCHNNRGITFQVPPYKRWIQRLANQYNYTHLPNFSILEKFSFGEVCLSFI